MEILLFWAQGTMRWFVAGINSVLRLFDWVFLLLQPIELVGQERVLHQHLWVAQILNHWDVLDLAHGKWHATNVLILILDSVHKTCLLRNSESVWDFRWQDVVAFDFVVYLLVYLDDVLVYLPIVLQVYHLFWVVYHVGVAGETQVL